jgi:integrase
MGGTRKGVDVRATSIRVTFTFEGKQYRMTLMLEGKPLRPTPPNVRYAERLAAEIRERIKYRTFSMAEYFPASGAASPTTVSLQLDTWLAAQRIEGSTRDGYASIVKFWKGAIGDKTLRGLKHSDVLTAIATRPDLSGKTVNNRVSVLREALALAVRDKLLPDNPVEGVKSSAYQKPAPDPFTVNELEAILADMESHYPAQVAEYTAFKFFTGVRSGESFGLQWPDVDLPARHMVIRQSIVSGREKASTKTNTARMVLLNSRALEAIQAQKARTFLRGAHVFTDPRDGKHWGGEPKFRFYWVATLKRLGIRHRPQYNTRHTYATLMLMAGMKPAFCAGQMGHSVELFLRTYAKWIPGAGDQAEMAKLEDRIAAIPNLSPKQA